MKVLDAVVVQDLLHPGPEPGLALAHRRGPLVGGPIGALGQPDALGVFAEMLAIGQHPLGHLEADGRVRA